MTYEQFLDRLRETPRHWRVIAGIIRDDGPHYGHCPLSAVADTFPLSVTHSAKKLGLDESLALEIKAASDGHRNADASIRFDLLDACGLVPPGITRIG